ncbi:uncharacterized protein JCM15063_001047 [Sporobolomyces koalae]|uniref:uncharacterized protein n=1 Tax=Sporobolomyces koalae TaxID=500713 RepID=UPI0031745A8A
MALNASTRLPRFGSRQILILVCGTVLVLYLFTSGRSPTSSGTLKGAAQRRAQLLDSCPYSTSHKHVPTVILEGSQESDKAANRTYNLGSAAFAPYSYPPRELRFAQQKPDGSKLAAAKPKPGQGRLHEGVQGDEKGEQLCSSYAVPSSPRPVVPVGWKNSKIMFGMSTTPDRVLWNLPVWQHWLPAALNAPLDPTNLDQVSSLPLLLVLTPPPNPTEEARTREAVEEAQTLGMYVEMRKREADRFETRYFALAEELYREALRRESQGGDRVEWFVFADDDTFFPDFDSLVRLLSSYDSNDDQLIGTLSESTKQVAQWGHIAYGGAGIYVSRATIEKMNSNDAWATCLTKFGSAFGGDAMISHCASLVVNKDIKDVLIVDDTLHQLDIRGDGTGFFQSGFLITSLHHWGSWFTIFPPWHETGMGDLRKGITLVGKAAKAVGGDNWGRRYTFENGKVVVSLGYSIVIEREPLTQDQLDQSEHTWWEFETFHPIRPGQEEGLDKRTYYITGVRTLSPDGIVRLEHKNREGERVDLIWDQRTKLQSTGGWF